MVTFHPPTHPLTLELKKFCIQDTGDIFSHFRRSVTPSFVSISVVVSLEHAVT